MSEQPPDPVSPDPVSPDPVSPESLEGVLELRVTNAGSKSERTSAVLVPDAGDPVTLHSSQWESLSTPPDLAAYAGFRVRLHGQVTWTGFLVARVELL